MKYIFLVAGPLHVLMVYEFIKKNNIKNYLIIFFSNLNDSVNKQVKFTCNFLKLKKFQTKKWSKFLILRYFEIFFFIYTLKKSTLNKKVNFVISDFKNLFYHILRIFFKKSKFFLIDEGIGTLVAYKLYIKKGIFFPINNYRKIFQYLLKFFFPNILRFLMYKKIMLFSFFASEKKEINNLFFLKKRINTKRKFSRSIVYFSGTKLSERGTITISEEMSLLKKINLFWKKKGKKLIYIAKRTTSEKKLSIIKNQLSIDCEKHVLPLEIILLHKKNLPYAICSHGSATNITLKILYGINSYIFISKKLKKKLYGKIEELYLLKSYSKIIYI